MIGDLAGFAAAVYMRGCAVIQIPTSLLAMVDSSVGGKTAVDLDAGKNLAGAFWQPAAVVADTACLRTVSANLLEDSCGEIIKYGVMRDPELFSSLERQPFGISDPHRVEAVVSRCIKLKRDVVAADERESGIRALRLPMPHNRARNRSGKKLRVGPWFLRRRRPRLYGMGRRSARHMRA